MDEKGGIAGKELTILAPFLHFLFGLPLFLFPGSSTFSILPLTYPASLLHRCPNHLNLDFHSLSLNRLTLAVYFTHSFLILYTLFTPDELLSILSSASCPVCGAPLQAADKDKTTLTATNIPMMTVAVLADVSCETSNLSSSTDSQRRPK